MRGDGMGEPTTTMAALDAGCVSTRNQIDNPSIDLVIVVAMMISAISEITISVVVAINDHPLIL